MKSNQFLRRVLPHVIVWSFLLVVPFMLGDYYGITQIDKLRLIPISWAMILFYLNYIYLIPKLFFRRKIGMYFLVNLLAVAGMLSLFWLGMELKGDVFQEMARQAIVDQFDLPPDHEQLLVMRTPRLVVFYRNGMLFLFAVGASLGVKVSQRWQDEERNRFELEKEQLRSEVERLKYQIQPHFFFNTINNIYSLIDTDKEKAKGTVHGLGKLMRYVLYRSNEQLVPLRDELDFLKAYVDVMKIRYGQNLTVKLEHAGIEPDQNVPPLLLITLVENTFKHGVDPEKPCEISIQLTADNERVRMTTANMLVKLENALQKEGGLGLSNLKKRLGLLYDEEEFVLRTNATKGRFTAEMQIPVTT